MSKPVAYQPEQLVLNIIAQAPRAPATRRSAKAVAAKPALTRMPKVSRELVANVSRKPVSYDHSPAFKVAKPMPGVVPKGKRIAMDSDLPAVSWAGASIANIAFGQGYTFLGYPYLSELAQVAEYRLISEVISTEATRKWVKIKSTSEDDDQTDRIDELEAEFKRLDVRAAFEQMSLQDGFFGRAHLYIDTGDTNDQKELLTPLGEGNKFTAAKYKKKTGWLRALKPVEPVWTYPMNYNAIDPLADDWYKPEVWYVMGKGIHVSRLLPFIAKPVPDLLKPAFSFGGLSLSQMAKPYIDNWLETRQSVNDIINAFSVMVLKTDLSTMMQNSGEDLICRADMFNGLRNSRGLMMLNKDSEDFANVSAPLGTLDKLQAQAQEHMASVSRIPLVKLLGISPAGLNASTDGEIRAFYDTIHAYQEKFFGPHLNTIFRLVQLSLWGEVDEDLTCEFEPLWELDEKDIVEMQRAKAETHEKYIEMGAADPEEVRGAIADDPNSPYPSMDPDEKPEIDVLPKNMKESETEDVDGAGAPKKLAAPAKKKPKANAEAD